MKAGWEVKTLKELCDDFRADIVDGPFGANLKREHYTSDGTPVLKIQNIKPFQIVLKKMDFVSEQKASELARHSYRNGDIIITKLGQPLGVSAIVSDLDPGIIVADLVRVRATKVDTQFLCYQLNSPLVSKHLNSLQKGTTRPRVQISAVRDLPINMPPLEEQKRIVSILDEAFEGLNRARENAEANLKSARELFESALDTAFKDESISWDDTAISSLGSVVTGATPKTSDKGNLGDYLPFVKPGDFLPNGCLAYGNHGLSKKGASVSRILPAGSALMVCIGATIGKAGFSDRPIATNQQINAVVPKQGIRGDYLYYQMLTPKFQADVIYGSGQATLPIINKGKWSKLTIRMPRDITKQDVIVDKLSGVRTQIDEATLQYKAQIADISDLRQSLLQKAFAGELT